MSSPTTLTTSAATVHRLDNGLIIVLEPLPYLRSATAGVWIRSGSAHETASQAGISHLLEHLFFKGTSTRTARQLSEAVEARGGHINAFTSRDYTCLYVKTLGEHIQSGLEVLADVLTDSQLCDFDKEKNVVIEEIATLDDVPEDYVHDLFTQRLWPDHAMGRPIAGTEDTVSGLTRDTVLDYYRQWYGPDNVIVAVAGAFDSAMLLPEMERLFNGLTPLNNARTVDPVTQGACFDHVDRDIAQDHLCFGFTAPSVKEDRRFAANLLSNALGGGFTSRLFEKVREDAGLAYSIYSFYSTSSCGGMLGVYAATGPENLSEALDLTFRELRDLRDNGMTADELELNREQLKGNLLMSLESTFNRMTRMAKSLMHFDRVVPVDEVVGHIEGVTIDDVQSLAQDLFRQDQCAAVVLGPDANGGKAEAAL
jgi:predicted Zn-dependent peptidase